MRRFALLVLLLAACGRDGGVIIDVTHTNTSVTQIRLFLGTGERRENETLALPGPPGAAEGVRAPYAGLTYWSRDHQNDLDVVQVDSLETVRFVLVNAPPSHVGSVIAVGYAGTQIVEVATLFEIDVPEVDFNRYELTLAAPSSPVLAWGPVPNTQPSDAVCIGVLDPARPDARFQQAFVVTPDDQDCDDFILGDGNECNPDQWRGSRPPELVETSCLVGDSLNGRCYLGGPRCTDGMPPGSDCTATNYCAPTETCVDCMLDYGCAQDVTKGTVQTPAFRCTIHTQSGQVCTDDLLLTGPLTTGAVCRAMTIATTLQPFADHVGYDQDKLKVYTELGASCRLALRPTGQVPSGNRAEVGSLVAIELANGRGVAVPVVFQIDRSNAGCAGQPVTCTADPTLDINALSACATGWGPPQVQDTLVASDSEDVHSPTLTDDELEIWYTGVGDREVYTATRMSKLAAWGPPRRVTELELGGTHTLTPEVSADGLRMYLASDRTPAPPPGHDIFLSTRQSRSGSWSTPAHVPSLSSIDDELAAAPTANDLLVAFTRRVDAAMSGYDIFVAARTAVNAPWLAGPPLQLVTTLNSNETASFVTADGGAIYFASDTMQSLGSELFVSPRVAAGGWMPGARIIELSTPDEETDPWVNRKRDAIYFVSNRDGTSRIYVARK